MSARYLVLNRLCGRADCKYLREKGTERCLKGEPKLLVFGSWYYMKSTWIGQNYMKIKIYNQLSGYIHSQKKWW